MDPVFFYFILVGLLIYDRWELNLPPTVLFRSLARGFFVLLMWGVWHLVRWTRIWLVGKLSLINAMAKRLNAQYVIHTGDFGFYDDESLDRMNEKW